MHTTLKVLTTSPHEFSVVMKKMDLRFNPCCKSISVSSCLIASCVVAGLSTKSISWLSLQHALPRRWFSRRQNCRAFFRKVGTLLGDVPGTLDKRVHRPDLSQDRRPVVVALLDKFIFFGFEHSMGIRGEASNVICRGEDLLQQHIDVLGRKPIRGLATRGLLPQSRRQNQGGGFGFQPLLNTGA